MDDKHVFVAFRFTNRNLFDFEIKCKTSTTLQNIFDFYINFSLIKLTDSKDMNHVFGNGMFITPLYTYNKNHSTYPLHLSLRQPQSLDQFLLDCRLLGIPNIECMFSGQSGCSSVI